MAPKTTPSKTIPFAIAITALATALVVGSYYHFTTMSQLQGQVKSLEGELSVAKAQAVDPAAIKRSSITSNSFQKMLSPQPRTTGSMAPHLLGTRLSR